MLFQNTMPYALLLFTPFENSSPSSSSRHRTEALCILDQGSSVRPATLNEEASVATQATGPVCVRVRVGQEEHVVANRPRMTRTGAPYRAVRDDGKTQAYRFQQRLQLATKRCINRKPACVSVLCSAPFLEIYGQEASETLL